MDQKRLLTLAAVFLVVLFAAWATGVFGGSDSTIELPDARISVAELASITIHDASGSVTLTRSGVGWRVTDPVDADADSSVTARLIRKLSELRIESVVSSQPERYSRFQVDDASAVVVDLAGGEDLVLRIGKTGPDFQSKYVRVNEDPRVFLAIGLPSVKTDVSYWRDKTLWDFAEADVLEVEATGPDGSLRLSRSGADWFLDGTDASFTADSALVARYLSRISSVSTDDFLSDLPVSAVTDSVTHTLTIRTTDGVSVSLTIRQRSTDAVAVLSGTEEVVKLATYRVKRLIPNIDDLVASP